MLPTSRKDAIDSGSLFYFSSVSCRHGHLDNRYVSTGECVVCVSLREKNRRAAAPDAYRAKSNARYAENPTYREKVKTRARENYRANPEPVRRRVAQWKLNNRAHCNDLSRQAYPRHKETISTKMRLRYFSDVPAAKRKTMAWREANPDIFKAVAQNTRAKRRAAVGQHTGQELRDLFIQQGGRCAYFSFCGNDIHTIRHADHIIPLSKGGTNWISNIQLCCPSCNYLKGSKDPLVFAKLIGIIKTVGD